VDQVLQVFPAGKGQDGGWEVAVHFAEEFSHSQPSWRYSGGGEIARYAVAAVDGKSSSDAPVLMCDTMRADVVGS